MRRAVLRAPLPTMTAAILVEESGDNRIVIVPGALSALTPAHVDAFAAQIEAADVLLVQLEIPVETALHALEVGRAAGVRTILNPAPAPAEPIAPAADYLTPNESEALPSTDAEGTLVVTLGDQGARLARGTDTGVPRDAGGHAPAPATRSARRSRSRWPRALRTPRRCAGAARPARTWSSTRA